MDEAAASPQPYCNSSNNNKYCNWGEEILNLRVCNVYFYSEENSLCSLFASHLTKRDFRSADLVSTLVLCNKIMGKRTAEEFEGLKVRCLIYIRMWTKNYL